MQGMIDKYVKFTGGAQVTEVTEQEPKDKHVLDAKEEINMLKNRITILQEGLSPTFSAAVHSNSHRKVLEMMRQKTGGKNGIPRNEACGYRVDCGE
nr:agamous-like MADS-box protein AGL12 isoform X2 [Ipomoea trifida]